MEHLVDAQEEIPCSGAAAFMLYPHPIQGHAQPAEGVRAIALDSPSAVAAACASMGGRVAQECTHLARGASATLANEPAPGVTSSPCSTRAVGSSRQRSASPCARCPPTTARCTRCAPGSTPGP